MSPSPDAHSSDVPRDGSGSADSPTESVSGASAPERITSLLHTIAAGSSGAPQARHDLLPLVYDHLRWIARAQLAHEPVECSVEATSLVHEAYLRIIAEGGRSGDGTQVRWVDRRHFFNTAARAMRFVLVDRARSLLAGRRRQGHDGDDQGAHRGAGGPRRPFTLPQNLVAHTTRHSPETIEAVEEALNEFERLDPRAAQVVVWRLYNDMTIEEVARQLECGVQTVNRDWRRARAWLADRLAHELPGRS